MNDVITLEVTPETHNGLFSDKVLKELARQEGRKRLQAKLANEEKLTSIDLITFLQGEGWDFRLNICDDSIEVNGERLSDVTIAQIKTRLRDCNLNGYLEATQDALIDHAAKHSFHPVRDYLEGLTYDGENHIQRLADHFTDEYGVFGLYLRKWLIGAVARAYQSTQNAMLVLDGKQGIGKSQFVKWLCPVPDLFVDGPINPDNKDHSIRAMRTWIWEVSELGATTRRADVEALKGFLSRKEFTERAPYGHYDLVKPGLASFIGTVNDSGGFFTDKTGSRRFFTTTITAIDWNYTTNVDINQVWAEAYTAYQNGETWTLNGEEAQRAREINATYEIDDPVENLLLRWFEVNPDKTDKWTSSAEILTTLQTMGLNGNTKNNSMTLSGTLKKLGVKKTRQRGLQGYVGVWERKP